MKEKKKGEIKVRFKLPPKAYKALCALVRERDFQLASVYHSIIGEYPPYEGGEYHHHHHVGNFGADREDNLILISFSFHRFKCHGLSWDVKKESDTKVDKYLSCEEVKAWREEHEEELEALYATEEDYRHKRIRKKYEIHRKT